MQTFEEWLLKKHPEILDENWRQTIGALTLAGASFLPTTNTQAATAQNVKAQLASQNQTAQKQKIRILRHIYELAKQAYDRGERVDSVVLIMQLEKQAPEYYEKGQKHHITIQELAAMPDDAYIKFLKNLKHNINDKEKYLK